MTAPKLWSAEKPNLYYVFYRLSDGNQTCRARPGPHRFPQGGDQRTAWCMVNGVPVKFTGVCRHEEFTPYGHALNEECWKTDITLMKAANINAIRTSPLHHAERFMELCDEAGFYVLDEIPSCWVATEINDPTRTWAYIFRSKETLDRDKNRACVVAWGCGNESGYGVNNQAEFDYVKAHDPTRLALISQQNLGQNPKTDFEDYHYPRSASIKAMTTNPNRAKVPVICTEYVGAERCWRPGLDGQLGCHLAHRRHRRRVHLGMAGPGHDDRFPERWSSTAPVSACQPPAGPRSTDSTADSTGMRPRAAAARSPRIARSSPCYWNLKTVYSPVNTTAREVAPAAGQCVVPLQNRYSFTDLAELTCRWQALAGEKVLASGESHIAAKPRSSVDASFPATPGMDTLRLEFIHPDGRSVYATRLHVKGLSRPSRSRRPDRHRACPAVRDRPELHRGVRRNAIGPRQAHRPDHFLARRRPGCRPRRADPQSRRNFPAVAAAASAWRPWPWRGSWRQRTAAPGTAMSSSRPTWMAPTPNLWWPLTFIWPVRTNSRANSPVPLTSAPMPRPMSPGISPGKPPMPPPGSRPQVPASRRRGSHDLVPRKPLDRISGRAHRQP